MQKKITKELSAQELKKMALEIAIKAGGKPILNKTLLTNAKQIYLWLRR